MRTVRINDENIVTVLNAGSGILSTFMAIAGWLLISRQFAIGVLAGGLLAIANFNWLCGVIKRAVLLSPETAKKFALIRYTLRISILALVIWALIVKINVDPLGLLVGLSVLIVNIFALTVYRLNRKGG